MSSKTSLLLQRPLDEPLAWLSDNKKPTTVSGQQFLWHVNQVAQQLPEKSEYSINLCDNRYLLLVSICAMILRKQCTLLPPNKNVATQQDLQERYNNAYVLHDGKVELAPQIQQISLADFDLTQTGVAENFQVDLDQVALISFTSGSTGFSKANIKTWRTLQQSTQINVRHMLPEQSMTLYHLATVPGQHMWGLETSVLMSLFANVCLVDAKPLFPNDILTLLQKIPSPVGLISTPLHLRALNISARDMDSVPELSHVLTATAPIQNSLAKELENRFNTTVTEVYGCSEVGSMAYRKPSQNDNWTQFEGLKFAFKGTQASVSTNYLPEPVTLDDQLEALNETQFKLVGRSTDQIKIAGKRGSLFEVNRVLNNFDGVIDGVVIFPEQTRLVPRLIALVVLKDPELKPDLQNYFREHLDAAFVPRPILLVDKLPREENGKLNKSVLHDFYLSLKND